MPPGASYTCGNEGEVGLPVDEDDEEIEAGVYLLKPNIHYCIIYVKNILYIANH